MKHHSRHQARCARDGVIGVELERLLEKRDRHAALIRHWRLQVGQRAQEQIVGVEILRTLSPRTFDLRAPHGRLDDADHAIGDLILELEHVLERAVAFVGPQVRAGLGFDKLR